MPIRTTLHTLAETDHWIVVAKPPRLLVHRNAHHPRAEACLQWVRDQVGGRVYPIHRLDFQTSGCLLFAKTRSWAAPLQQALALGQKTYVAFVRGHYSNDSITTVTTPMKDDNGILKAAESTVVLLGRSHDPRCSLLKVEPKTGRFHQVRRHVRDLHHPCIGDSDHGDTRVNRWWRENTRANRLGLHCLRLTVDPREGPPIRAECPLFDDQYEVFQSMPWWADAVAKEPGLDKNPLPLPCYQEPTEE